MKKSIFKYNIVKFTLLYFFMLIDKEKQFDIWDPNITIPILALDIVIFTVYKWALCFIVSKINDKNQSWFALPWWIVSKWFNLEENFDDILKRKTWISWVYKEQLYTFWNVDRDTRWHVVSVIYYALVSIDSFLTKVDFTKVDIIKFSDIDQINLFYDHNKVIKYAKQRIEWKFEYTNIANKILPKKFKMSQLQNIYEIITWNTYDKRNFQKKIFSLNILKETWEFDKSTNRPAKLYSFIEQELSIIEKNSFV